MFAHTRSIIKNLANSLEDKKHSYKEFIILTLIILLFSKEVIVNDYEIVIIYSLFVVLIISYFNFKLSISQMFSRVINQIKEDYKVLLHILLAIEKNIVKNLFSYNLLTYLRKNIFILIYKSLYLLNKYIKINLVKFNSILIKLSLLKININSHNKEKTQMNFLNKLTNLTSFEIENTSSNRRNISAINSIG